jgi:lipopolysaccharide biosynthesis regulator YciM
MFGFAFDWQLYLAILAALAFGFWQGARYKGRSNKGAAHSPDRDYFQGLNFLLNEEPDAAIDSFVKALEVNSETLETHLALANLLRKRGEVDRAIRIHQNLLARPGLTKEQSQQAQYELSVDFTKAGLLDRAEGLLVTLIKEEGPFQQQALVLLLGVYRDEKEWENGLAVLQRLSGSRFSKCYEKWAATRAHFCCELAENAIIESQFDTARRWLKQALAYYKQSARASLLLGRLEIASGNLNRGIQQLQRIVEQNPDYVSEALPYLADGYRRVGQLDKYRAFLNETYQHLHNPIIVAALTDVIALQDGEAKAAEFIAKEVRDHPSGVGLHKLLDYYLAFADPKTKEHLASLQTVMQRVILRSPQYQCGKCGFKGQKLHWLCPSCKQWGMVKPIQFVGEDRYSSPY